MIRLLLLSLMFTLPACGPVSSECSSDMDCKGERICEAGACQGAEGNTPATDDPKPGDNPPATGTYTCCLNDTGYICPDQRSFDACAGFDLGACLERCTGPDFTCMDTCFDKLDSAEPDPSGCMSDPNATCESGGPSGGSCRAGSACDYDDDCDSKNCADGFCYENAVGCKCDYDDDCDSKNCTGGACAGNGRGDACDYDDDCDSRNCTGGKCAGN